MVIGLTAASENRDRPCRPLRLGNQVAFSTTAFDVMQEVTRVAGIRADTPYGPRRTTERPSGARDLSLNPKNDFYPTCPDPIGEEHRSEALLFSFTVH